MPLRPQTCSYRPALRPLNCFVDILRRIGLRLCDALFRLEACRSFLRGLIRSALGAICAALDDSIDPVRDGAENPVYDAADDAGPHVTKPFSA